MNKKKEVKSQNVANENGKKKKESKIVECNYV